jgi:hypothetical protein
MTRDGGSDGGDSVAFTKTSRLLSDLAGVHDDRTWTTRLRRVSPRRAVDPRRFRNARVHPAQADDIYELISELGGRPIAATSNRTPGEPSCQAHQLSIRVRFGESLQHESPAGGADRIGFRRARVSAMYQTS